MRFEVPQFIEVEDKIFGPFTWKQFIYLAGGGGAVAILYIFLPTFLFVVFALPLALLVAGLAFYKPNNRPFVILLESALRYVGSARLYLWRRAEDKKGALGAADPTKNLYTPPSSANSIASLSRKLEINALEKKE